jgi:leucyl aminopeptidase
MWRLPLLEDLKDQLKSDCADLKHTGDRWGGSISAALFLREFVGNVPNWVHCDIAGPAMGDRVRGWDPKGGTGHGVLTFLSLIEASAQREGTVKPLPAGTTDGVKPSRAEGPRAAKATVGAEVEREPQGRAKPKAAARKASSAKRARR